MYTKSVSVKDSSIQGKGVFTDEDIKKGDIVWKFDPNHDLALSLENYQLLTEQEKEEFSRVAYLSATTGQYVFPPENDPARFTNHDSKSHNLSVVVDISVSPEPYFVANRNIKKGEELTNNYHEFDEAIKSISAVQDWLK